MNPVYIITTDFEFPLLPKSLGGKKKGYLIYDAEYHTQLFDTTLPRLPKTPKHLLKHIVNNSENKMLAFVFAEITKQKRDIVINSLRFTFDVWKDFLANNSSKKNEPTGNAQVIDMTDVIES